MLIEAITKTKEDPPCPIYQVMAMILFDRFEYYYYDVNIMKSVSAFMKTRVGEDL